MDESQGHDDILLAPRVGFIRDDQHCHRNISRALHDLYTQYPSKRLLSLSFHFIIFLFLSLLRRPTSYKLVMVVATRENVHASYYMQEWWWWYTVLDTSTQDHIFSICIKIHQIQALMSTCLQAHSQQILVLLVKLIYLFITTNVKELHGRMSACMHALLAYNFLFSKNLL